MPETSAQPRITIAMAVHNGGAALACALESLRWQTCADWNLILLDDGSTDGSVTTARAYADPRIYLVCDGQRRGLAARLNQAIDLATGTYFARMDADDVAYPRRLATQLAFLERHPDIDLVGTGALVFSGNGAARGVFPCRETHEEICRRPWAGFYLAHPTWMGRTAWFRRHRYDATAKKAQDQVLLLNAYETSRLACVPDILLGYRQERVSLAKAAAGRFHFCRGLVRLGARRGKPVFALRGVIEQAAKLLVELIVIPTGLARRLLSHRAAPPPAHVRDEWWRVWTELCDRVAKRSPHTGAPSR